MLALVYVRMRKKEGRSETALGGGRTAKQITNLQSFIWLEGRETE